MPSAPENVVRGRVLDSLTTAAFWKRYHDLPEAIQKLADRAYSVWSHDPRNPSLRFKPFKNNQWSARIGDHYRAVGRFVDGSTFVWTWIGSHEAYNKL